MARNPNWTRDELILAIELYFKVNPLHTSEKHSEIIALSNLLNELPIHPERHDQMRFRNPDAVYMKLCNFLRLDPSYHGAGLNAGSRLDEEVWNDFANNRTLLVSTAKAIRDGYKLAASPSALGFTSLGEEEEFPEGRILYRLHRLRERNSTLVRKKKLIFIERYGLLKCEVCGFCFENMYGDIGKNFIECHHSIPVSELGDGKPTKLAELVLVCSNCHRMLHRKRPWLTLEGLVILCHSTTSS